MAVNLSGELQFGNIYVKIEGSIDFLKVWKYTLRSKKIMEVFAMMKWEAPEVKELNVQETAGGQSDMPIECYCGCPCKGGQS